MFFFCFFVIYGQVFGFCCQNQRYSNKIKFVQLSCETIVQIRWLLLEIRTQWCLLKLVASSFTIHVMWLPGFKIHDEGHCFFECWNLSCQSCVEIWIRKRCPMISLRRCPAATRHVLHVWSQMMCDRQKLLIDDNLKRHRFIHFIHSLRLDIYWIYEFFVFFCNFRNTLWCRIQSNLILLLYVDWQRKLDWRLQQEDIYWIIMGIVIAS